MTTIRGTGRVGRAIVALAVLGAVSQSAAASSTPSSSPAAPARSVYWTTGSGDIGRAGVDGSGVDETFLTAPSPFEVAAGPVAVTSHYLFWVPWPPDDGCYIARANLDGTGVDPKFLRLPSCEITALAADESHVYFGVWDDEAGAPSIGRADVFGTGVDRKFLEIPCEEASTVGSIALDAHFLYWTGGCSFSIHRVGLDGAGEADEWIPSDDAQWVAVSPTSVYWTAGDLAIHRAKVDGSGVNDTWFDATAGDETAQVGAIAADADFVYWVATRDDGTSIGRVPAGGGSPAVGFIPTAEAASGLTVMPAKPLGVLVPAGTATGTVTVNDKPFSGGAVPFGSTVDVKRGRLHLSTGAGDADVYGSGVPARFTLLPTTVGGRAAIELRLAGGDFSVCKKPKRKPRGGGKPKASKATVRRLFVKADGLYRTRGRYASATGTAASWLLADRCDGTFEQTFDGTTSVRDFGRAKTTRVSPGGSYLARKG